MKGAIATGAAKAATTASPWGWYYLAVMMLLLVPEIYWVFVNGANTISATIWGLEGPQIWRAHPFDFSYWTPVHYIIGSLLLITMVWLFLHLVFGALTT